MDRELSDDIHESIKRFCAEGDSLVEAKRYSDAVTRFEQAGKGNESNYGPTGGHGNSENCTYPRFLSVNEIE